MIAFREGTTGASTGISASLSLLEVLLARIGFSKHSSKEQLEDRIGNPICFILAAGIVFIMGSNVYEPASRMTPRSRWFVSWGKWLPAIAAFVDFRGIGDSLECRSREGLYASSVESG